ncbi:MAG TPA: hypothetical protein VGK00_06760 [Anaerolineales bacterium]|jgi:hypothetical protein
MQKIRTFFQLVEWIVRYMLLTPAQRRMLLRRFKPRDPGGRPGPDSGADALQQPLRLRYHWVGEASLALPQAPRALPPFAPALMRAITGSVIVLTAFSLWNVSHGWVEALYSIPLFVIVVLVCVLSGGLSRPGA